MTIIRQKWQPIWHQLTHFQTKDNATQNLYLQALNSSHRPIRKFIVVFKRLVFFHSVYPSTKPSWVPGGHLVSAHTYQAKSSRFFSSKFPL